ncbi:hypothetical protein A1O7_04572 [Cladophialophora yegresii CBS 114405]|uniref:Apple domain-containing protein n=1 Tax=Cladophialophora yegresii CBS 114405 TaxID=1182544 RepID=W9W600_9EURO|nr:uncharacterized protein A1O7_04572 [Cladophialophora yegresii CBS 114405]EXJ60420.1 hypothetical protein A1O7_04572 [Cladophialophora yegresii CBS 114405]
MLPFFYFFLFSNVALGSLGRWEGYLPWKKNFWERDVEPTCSCNDPLAAEWASNKVFSDAASSAATPIGYYEAFSNGQTWNSGDGFLGHTTLDEYDSSICAAICDSMDECSSFQIYFEKQVGGVAPSIKCSFSAGSITVSHTNGANAVIAGNNGYTNSTLTTPEGFDVPTFLADSAIHPPPESGSFIGSEIFYGSFDTANCASACSAVDCKFFNTYVVSKNGVNQGQYCDLYSQPYGPEYATETGSSDGETTYSISHSFTCGWAGDKRGEDRTNTGSDGASATIPVGGGSKDASWEDHHPWHGSSPPTDGPGSGDSGSSTSSKGSTTSGSSAGRDGGHTVPVDPTHTSSRGMVILEPVQAFRLIVRQRSHLQQKSQGTVWEVQLLLLILQL